MKIFSPEQTILVENNMPLAKDLAGKFHKVWLSFMEFEDVESICYEGLARAAKTFKPERGFAFSTFATNVIRNWTWKQTKTARERRERGERPPMSLEVWAKNLEWVDWRDFLPDPQTWDCEDQYIGQIVVDNFLSQAKNLIPPMQPRQKAVILYKLEHLGADTREVAKAVKTSKTTVNKAYRIFKPIVLKALAS